jgi:hypothetical protein
VTGLDYALIQLVHIFQDTRGQNIKQLLSMIVEPRKRGGPYDIPLSSPNLYRFLVFGPAPQEFSFMDSRKNRFVGRIHLAITSDPSGGLPSLQHSCFFSDSSLAHFLMGRRAVSLQLGFRRPS